MIIDSPFTASIHKRLYRFNVKSQRLFGEKNSIGVTCSRIMVYIDSRRYPLYLTHNTVIDLAWILVSTYPYRVLLRWKSVILYQS